MGNRQSGHKYSFQDRFDLLENGPLKSGHYKLQSRENRQLYIGRQLTCNDQNQAYELQYIINEKLNNPSPFVNKLINSQTGYQQTYCSSDHKFYLLYREVPKLLFDQINERSANARPFLVEQIDTVINRVAKGLKYLYDINHHHGFVSARSISWSMRPKQSIQLIDEWALANNNSKQQKNRVFRPKDQQDIDQKMLQKSNDLYSLGIVARQMINMTNGQNSLYNQQGFSQLNNKIQVLLSPQPMDRLIVYNMLNTFIVQNQIMESKPLQRINTTKIMQLPDQNTINTTTYQQMPPNYPVANHPPHLPHQYEVFNKVSQHQSKNNRPPTNINNFIYPRSQFQTTNKIPISNSLGYGYVPNVNTLPIHPISAAPPKNLSLSVSKNNLHTSTSLNHDNFSRNASVGKINFSVPPPSLNHISSSAKFNTQVASTASLKNSYIQNQVNIVPNSTITASTSNIVTNSITKQPEQSNIIQQTKPTIQFSQTSKQSLKSSLINTEPQVQQSASISKNKSVVNFNPPLKKSYIQPFSHISNVNTSIPIATYHVNQALKISHSSLSNNMEINQVNPSLNNFNNVNPSYSNTGGLSYSFGHSDNTFSFKGLVGSSNQENLFTAPDFYTKIRQSNPNMRQSHSLANIQSLKPQINTLTSCNIPLNSSQNPSRTNRSSAIIEQYQRNHNSMDIDKYLSIRESEPISKASSQKQKQLEQKAKQKKQWQSQLPAGSWMSQYPYKSSSSRQKDKNDYFSTSYNMPTKTSGRKRYVDETSAQFYQKIAITSNNYNNYTPSASTFNYSKYTDYSKYDTILGTLPSLPSYKNSGIVIKDKKSNHYEQTNDYKQDISRNYQPNSKSNQQEHQNKANMCQIIQNQQNITKKVQNKANTISPALQKPIEFSPSQSQQKMSLKKETVQKTNIKLDPVSRDRAITSQIQNYQSQQQYIQPENIKNSNTNLQQQYTVKNNTINNFNHIDQNQSYSVSPTSNKSSGNQIEQSNIQVHEVQDRQKEMKLIIKENNNQSNIYKQIFQNYGQNSNNQQKNKSPSESPLPEQEPQPQQNYLKNIDNARTTPGKHTNSNQPFSTIPEVSQRSMSMKSDQERDYVIEQYQNGSRYEGYKSNGMRNGKGKFYYQQGSFYDGEWKNNNMHGYGKLYYSNNKLAYEGEWFIDQFHGRGRVFNDQPSNVNGFFDYTNFDNLDQKWKYYEGDLVCDSKQGEGKLVLSNDQYYEGQFRNDKVQGKGRFVTKNGQIINGVWEDSKLYMKL